MRKRYCGQVSAKTLSPSPRACRDPRRAFGGRHVEDHDRLVDEGGERDDPVEGLGLAAARMAHAVVARRAVAVGDEPLAGPRDHGVVLGMHADERAVVARGVEHVEQLHVVELDAVVGHEHLDGGMTGLHQLRNVIPERRLGRIGDDHVEGVVDHRALAWRARDRRRPPRRASCRCAGRRTGSPWWCRRTPPRPWRSRRCRH